MEQRATPAQRGCHDPWVDGRIELLGDFSCAGPAGAVDRRRLAPRRTRVALARLVLARGEPVTRDALAEALWSDALPPTWEAALRTVVADVRTVLAE
jgi:DNA-binding SARP family transcriptional activator